MPQPHAVAHFIQIEHQKMFISSIAPYYESALQEGQLDTYLKRAAVAFETRWPSSTHFPDRSHLVTVRVIDRYVSIQCQC